MNRMLILLNRLPVYFMSGVVMLAITALTLMPGDSVPDVPMFANADKVVHAVMFGSLAVTILWDAGRRSHNVSMCRYAMSVVVASAFGCVIEVLQEYMGLGRSGDVADWLADVAGAVVLPLLLWRVVKYLVRAR